ncbi:MAG: large-conductance mechanosensitive channel protein MscL [Nitrospirota bacterium]|nr:large-conductance mechanosensitive channel protein MscL [Nitrospirota bacterium]
MLKEFKAFLNRGNVMDLAVGVIIGAAFGKIVASLVDNVISPIIGFVLGGVNLNDALPLTLREASMNADGTEAAPALVMKVGAFLQSMIDFVIIAFVIFLIVKAFNNMKKKEEAAPAAPPAPTMDQTLLTEIRDLLKK